MARAFTAPYETFIFEGYQYQESTKTATFRYSFDGAKEFSETVRFGAVDKHYDRVILDRCLELALFLVGISYYKCFPTRRIEYREKNFSPTQADFINRVYREGLSQFVFENDLDPSILTQVTATEEDQRPLPYQGRGIIAMQSGGKDSLLLGELLNEAGAVFTPLFVSTSATYPAVIDTLTASQPRLIYRTLDHDNLNEARRDGGLNGHVPVTFIVMAYSLIDAVLHNDNVVLAAIGKEGEEPHAMVGDLAVNHQWSKTWAAEQLFSEYIRKLISLDLYIGSPLRQFTELKIAELFTDKCWDKYGDSFSSCNIGNYMQGQGNSQLKWCGHCAKCANSFILFSPFLEPAELEGVFGGVNLYGSEVLQDEFKGLLGIEGVIKPFECVGEVDELRAAYHLASQRYGDRAPRLPFDVPASSFNYDIRGVAQPWTDQYLPEELRQKV